MIDIWAIKLVVNGRGELKSEDDFTGCWIEALQNQRAFADAVAISCFKQNLVAGIRRINRIQFCEGISDTSNGDRGDVLDTVGIIDDNGAAGGRKGSKAIFQAQFGNRAGGNGESGIGPELVVVDIVVVAGVANHAAIRRHIRRARQHSHRGGIVGCFSRCRCSHRRIRRQRRIALRHTRLHHRRLRGCRVRCAVAANAAAATTAFGAGGAGDLLGNGCSRGLTIGRLLGDRVVAGSASGGVAAGVAEAAAGINHRRILPIAG